MNRQRFNISVDATVLPVSVADVKLYSRIPNDAEDDLVNTWVKAATKMAQDYQSRSYLEQTYILTYDSWPESCLDLPMPPLISVESIKYYDVDNIEATFASSNYYVDLNSEIGRVSLNNGVSWPNVILRPLNGFEVTFKAGYGVAASDVPDTVKNAIYIYCTHMYENREGEPGDVPKEFFDLLRPDKMVVL